MFEAFALCSSEQHRLRASELRERGHALPGTAAALDTVARLEGVVQTVVTGNIRSVAETKLSVFGLDGHIRFPYGGYGGDDEWAELVRLAMRRASQGMNAQIAPADTLLASDTPADVAVGPANGVPVLAVASGRSDVEELREAGATSVVASLEDPQSMPRALGWS